MKNNSKLKKITINKTFFHRVVANTRFGPIGPIKTFILEIFLVMRNDAKDKCKKMYYKNHKNSFIHSVTRYFNGVGISDSV